MHRRPFNGTKALTTASVLVMIAALAACSGPERKSGDSHSQPAEQDRRAPMGGGIGVPELARLLGPFEVPAREYPTGGSHQQRVEVPAEQLVMFVIQWDRPFALGDVLKVDVEEGHDVIRAFGALNMVEEKVSGGLDEKGVALVWFKTQNPPPERGSDARGKVAVRFIVMNPRYSKDAEKSREYVFEVACTARP